MKNYLFIFVIFTLFFIVKIKHPSEFINSKNKIYFTNNVEKEENLEDINCPIPMKDRVLNKTEIQCVWASIEMLGRWAEEDKLIIPPLTNRGDCKGYSSPSSVERKLNELNVNFIQSYRNEAEGLKLIRRAMEERRGCLWSVPGHAMVIVHFDEKNDVFKWVDNSDYNLKIQTSNMKYFYDHWESWVLVVYGDYSKIENKIKKNYNLPIFQNGQQIEYNKDYIQPPKNQMIISY